LNGAPIPLIEPARWFDDHLEFDRLVCACGLKEFCRRPLPGEEIGPEGNGVLVREIQVGIRLRAIFISGRA
jgi:hypothetical protein